MIVLPTPPPAIIQELTRTCRAELQRVHRSFGGITKETPAFAYVTACWYTKGKFFADTVPYDNRAPKEPRGTWCSESIIKDLLPSCNASQP